MTSVAAARNHMRKAPQIDPAYQKTADATGGQVYVLDRHNPEQLGAVLALSTSANKQELLSDMAPYPGSALTKPQKQKPLTRERPLHTV
jgi:hypothetical protein